MIVSDIGGKEFEQLPPGTELGICIKVIDLGTQEGEYQGVKNSRHQVLIQWELPNSLMSEGDAAGKPFVIGKFYTASLSDKAKLRHDLVSWRGREFTEEELAGFDLKNILGKPCMLSLTVNTKGKTVVNTIMAVIKGMPIPQQVNNCQYFSLAPDRFDRQVYESLSKGLREKFIDISPEFKMLMAANKPVPVEEHHSESGFDDLMDDIPF